MGTPCSNGATAAGVAGPAGVGVVTSGAFAGGTAAGLPLLAAGCAAAASALQSGATLIVRVLALNGPGSNVPF